MMMFEAAGRDRSVSIALLDCLADREPDELALSYHARGRGVISLTVRELHDRILQAASFIESEGGAGRPVVLLHGPGLEFLIDFLGCLLVGAPAVPLSPQTGEAALCAVFSHTNAAFAMIDRLDASMLKDPRGGPIRVCEDAGGRPRIHTAGPDDLAVIQFTSGTSGRARGVKVTHAMISANMAQIERAFDFRPAERHEAVSLWLPHFHDMGLFSRLQCLFSGVPCHLMSPLEFVRRPLSWLELVARTRSSVTGAPNFAYQTCAELADDPSAAGIRLDQLRLAFCGAEPIQPETVRAFTDGFAPSGFNSCALTPCYGMAEATLMISCAPLSRPLKTLKVNSESLRADRIEAGTGRELVSCGAPCRGLEVAILDQTGLERAAERQVGEILLRGPNVAQGYVGETRDRDDYVDLEDEGSPWLRTGDRGALVDGELYVTGRIKTLVIVNGRNFDANDLEDCAVNAHPSIAAAACQARMTRYGERPELLLELDARSVNDHNVEPIFKAVEDAVWSYAELRPVRLTLTPRRALPRTTSGKLRRSVAFERLEAGTIAVLAAKTVSDALTVADTVLADFEEVLLQLAISASGRISLDPAASLLDQGLDSLALHRFVTGLRALTGDLLTLEILYELQPGDTPLTQLAVLLDAALVEAVAALNDSEASVALHRLAESD